MKILLVYGTNSSGTAVVAKSIAEHLESAGYTVTLQHARETKPEDFRSDIDLIILGSCTWERFTPEGKRLEGQLQQHMFALLEKTDINPKHRFALFGLGDSSYTDFCAAADHLEEAVRGWMGEIVVPTLRIDSYFYDLKKNRQLVADWSGDLINRLAA